MHQLFVGRKKFIFKIKSITEIKYILSQFYYINCSIKKIKIKEEEFDSWRERETTEEGKNLY